MRRVFSRLWENSGMIVVYIVLFALLSLFVPFFFTWRNMIAFALSISMLGMVACTMLFCLASGHFDLSVSSIVAFSGVVAGVVINGTGSVILGILGGILAGGVFGLLNGVIIAKAHINALITTLAMLHIARELDGALFGCDCGARGGEPYRFGIGNVRGTGGHA